MARIDTLANFLTDVAVAIKNKTGKMDAITPANFDTEINSIEVSGDSNENILPDGYVQLEYIASDGTQIIDTGFQPTAKTEFEITFSTQNELVYSGDFGSIFGARYTYNAGGYQLATFAPSDGGSHNIGAFMFGDVFHSGHLKNDGSVQTVTFKNGLYTGGNGGTKDLSSITSVNTLGNLYLFACYETAANITVDPGKMTLYSCRFEENGEVIRNFIPVRRTSDLALGLYDFVTERFFMSDRGNNFTAGPEKVIANNSSINMFIQEEEPETKKGVWVKTSANIKPTISTISQNDITKTAGGWAPVGAYANLPHPNGYALATGYKGIMYFGGGYGSQARNLYSYDMTTNAYTKLPDIPYSFGWGGLCAYEDELYMFGGMGGPTTAYKYNIAEQTYTRLADIPVGFVSAVAVVCNNEIFLITGRPSESSSTRYNTIYKYNPADNVYTLCSATIHSGDCKSAVCFDNCIYIFGSDKDYKACYRYDPAMDTATRMSDIPFDCTDTYTCATQDAIYLVGSSRSSRALWKYEPALDRYERLPDAPLEIWGPGSGALINDRYLFAIGDISQHVRVLVYEIPQTEYQSTLFNGVMIDCSTTSRTTELVDNLAFYFTRMMYYVSGQKQNDVEIYYGNGVNWVKL